MFYKKNRVPKLILFDGVTGAGKSFLLAHLRKEYTERIIVGAKLTTRQRRIGDNDWEFRFVERIPELYNRYSYNSVGNYYAIDHEEFLTTIDLGLIYVVSCVDIGLMKNLISDFDTTIIYVYRSWKEGDLEELLALRGTLNQIDLQLRREEVASIALQYLNKIELYDHVLLNVGSKPDIINQLSEILLSYGISRDGGSR